MKCLTKNWEFLFVLAVLMTHGAIAGESFPFPRSLAQAQVGEWATYHIDTVARDGEKTSSTIRRTLLSKTDKTASFRIETLNEDGSVKDTVGSEIDLNPVDVPPSKNPGKTEIGESEIKTDKKVYQCQFKKTHRTIRPADQDIEVDLAEYYSADVLLDGLVKREKVDSLGFKQVTILVACGITKA